MTIVHTVDAITAWAKENICSKIKFKRPPQNPEDTNAGGYQYELLVPACFPLFVPSQDKLPPSATSPIPSLCVRIIEGTDNIYQNHGAMKLDFCFSTWSTGTHGKDIFYPVGSGIMHQWDTDEAEQYFQRNYEGWRDAWNWVDIAVRELESNFHVDGLEIDLSSIKFYPLNEQESIPDYYPFWFAVVAFTVKRQIIRNVEAYQDLL